MKNITYIGLAAALTFPALAFAQEHSITRSQLPPAVESSLGKQMDGATVKGFSTERENGKTVYEAELLVNGHSKDVSFAANGEVQEVEEQVDLASLPPDVTASLTAKAKGGKIAKVESLTKHGKLVAYEAAVDRNGRHSEIQVGPHGGKLQHEE